MPESDEKGRIVITMKDIYDQQNSLSEEVSNLSKNFEKMTSSLKDVKEIEKISRKALEIANNADDKSDQALKNDEKVERQKEQLKNVWVKSLLATLLPWGLALVVGVILLVKNGGI